MVRDIFGNIIRKDPLTGRKTSKKKLNKERTAEIRSKGKAGEDNFRMKAQLSGYEVERTGRGSDFRIKILLLFFFLVFFLL